MPLELLIAAICVAIALVIVIIYLLGSPTLEGGFDSEWVENLLTRDHPGFQVDRTVFDSAGHGALILPVVSGSPVGLVWQTRRKVVAYILTKDNFSSFNISGPELKINMRNTPLGSMNFLIDDPDDLEDLGRALSEV